MQIDSAARADAQENVIEVQSCAVVDRAEQTVKIFGGNSRIAVDVIKGNVAGSRVT